MARRVYRRAAPPDLPDHSDAVVPGRPGSRPVWADWGVCVSGQRAATVQRTWHLAKGCQARTQWAAEPLSGPEGSIGEWSSKPSVNGSDSRDLMPQWRHWGSLLLLCLCRRRTGKGGVFSDHS